MNDERNNSLIPENKMGTMPIGKLLLHMSLPPMISMLVAALYNIVDGLFLARVSEDALTAVTLVFPVQMIMMAINVGIGVGLASLISRRLGEKRQDEADSAATHGMFFVVLTWVLYTLFAFTLAEPFLRLYTGAQGTDAINDEIFDMALTYCRIVMVGSIFINMSVSIERILQATGNTLAPMVYNLAGCGTNIVLAPIMIMGYFGVPALGVAGAGYAAIISQCIGCIIAVIIFFGKKHAVKIHFRGFRLRWPTIRDILAVGAPTIVMQAVNPILISSLNMLLFSYTSAVFILGVYFRISTFAILPCVGLNQGALPIMGYNYGAKNRLRLMAVYKAGIKVALTVMIIGTVIFWVFPAQIMMLFSAEGEALEMGVHALRAISIHWIPAAFVFISLGMFQALAHGIFALTVSIVRQIGFILPLAYILLTFIGIDAVWYAYPLAEVAAFALTAIFMYHVYKKEITKLPDGVVA